MPAGNDDWRLTGQERWARGLAWTRKAYVRPRPHWDHDHCEFCSSKFMEPNARVPGALTEGYVASDAKHWVCATCFEDFRAMFGWTVTST